jgi:hypothetical protein
MPKKALVLPLIAVACVAVAVAAYALRGREQGGIRTEPGAGPVGPRAIVKDGSSAPVPPEAGGSVLAPEAPIRGSFPVEPSRREEPPLDPGLPAGTPEPVVGAVVRWKRLLAAGDQHRLVEALHLSPALQSPEAVPALMHLAQRDPDARVRAQATSLLGRREDVGTDFLWRQMEDESEYVRAAAMAALARRGEWSAVERAVNDPSEYVRHTAEVMLAQRPPR